MTPFAVRCYSVGGSMLDLKFPLKKSFLNCLGRYAVLRITTTPRAVQEIQNFLELIQETVFSHPGRSTAALWVSSDIQRDNSHLRHNHRRHRLCRHRRRRRHHRRPPNQPS